MGEPMDEASSERPSMVGKALEHFALPDLRGKIWSPVDLVGKPAVLFCFATW
jgi:hypothetical protein